MKTKKKISQVKVVTVLKAFAIAILVYIFAIGAGAYFIPLTSDFFKNKIIRKTVQWIPYPAAFVGASIVSANDLLFSLDGVKHFYEKQDYSGLGLRVDFSTQDGKKRLALKEKEILGKLIESRVIELEAKKRGITISQEMIDQEVDRKLKEYGTEEYLKDNLGKLYGWDTDDFKKYIVKPDLYKEKLFEKFRENEGNFADAKKKIENAKDDLDSGKDFSQVAQEYSEGDSAKDGGELGWFRKEQMLPEVAVQVFSQEKGATSGIMESSLGYHIIKVEDKKTEEGEEMVKVSQIFVRTHSFSDWFLEAESKYKIYPALSQFIWNREESRLNFRDQDMKEYERSLMESPLDDPSVIF